MKLVIFGATGTLGRHLVRRALEQGHSVTAFARHPEALKLKHQNLKRWPGDVLDAAAVTDAVNGHDAVLIALGAGRNGQIRSTGTRHVVSAMQHHGIRKLVCMSSLGAGDSHVLLNFFWKYIMFGLLLRPAMADHNAQEAIVRQADNNIDWVIVRPAAFTDGEATGDYHHGAPLAAANLKLKISRADVADFLLKQLTNDTYLRRAPSLSY